MNSHDISHVPRGLCGPVPLMLDTDLRPGGPGPPKDQPHI